MEFMDLLLYLHERTSSGAFFALLILCVADVLTGVMTGVFVNSNKTEQGGVSSRPLLKGVCKKSAVIILVISSIVIDYFVGDKNLFITLTSFLIATEGLSILENLSIIGLPIPEFLRNILEVLKGGDKNKR